jgi:hypothetical protein
MAEFIDGIERQIPSSASARTRLALNALRARLKASRIAGGRKRFEQDLEDFIQNNVAVRGAAERYLCSIMIPAVEAANVALKKADKFLRRARAHMRLV